MSSTISDAILTECQRQDKYSQCGIETLVKDVTVVLTGEITTTARINYNAIVERAAQKIGYPAGRNTSLAHERALQQGADGADEHDRGSARIYRTHRQRNISKIRSNMAAHRYLQHGRQHEIKSGQHRCNGDLICVLYSLCPRFPVSQVKVLGSGPVKAELLYGSVHDEVGPIYGLVHVAV